MFSKSIVAAALVAGAASKPVVERWDACAAAVTGTAAVGDASIRSADCSSFLATTVTPPAITTTVTLPGISTISQMWERGQVTSCPNKVPAYAVHKCGGSNEGAAIAAYSSACSWLGYSYDSTTSVAPTTTTKIVYVMPTSASTYASSSAVATVTVTATQCATVTVNAYPPTGTANSTDCVTDSDAIRITSQFASLITSQDCGSTLNAALVGSLFGPGFTDTSDSINFMAQKPLTTVTFNSSIAFLYGQGAQQCVSEMETLNVWHDCSTITWRWRIFLGPDAAPVTGINVMEINDDKEVVTNYSEFNNGAWLYDLGNPQCRNQTAAAVAAATANCTAPDDSTTKRSLENALLH